MDKARETHFHVMLGICIETLCSNRTYSDDSLTIQVLYLKYSKLIFYSNEELNHLFYLFFSDNTVILL